MAKATIAIVTGSNRGIGRAICTNIARRPAISPPLVLYATSRGGHDLGLQPTSALKIVYHKLDISSDQSINDLLSHIKKTHEDGEVGVLINNAAVEFDHKMYTAQNAKKTLDVNYRGTLNSGLMPSGSRIVNLSSAFGSNLSPYSPEVRRKFRSSREDMTLDQLEELARQFEKAAEEGKEKEKGFGGRMRSYGFSKACVNAATAILARKHPDLVINCCCPGWVSTDMGNVVGRASKSPDDGAIIPVRLAFEDLGGVTGEFWANDSYNSRGDGKVQVW